MTTFDLRLHFIGLALFVPQANTRMHVLLPRHDGHDSHDGHGGEEGHDGHDGHDEHDGSGRRAEAAGHTDRHFARIVYDTAYEHDGPGRQLHQQLTMVNIERGVLDLTPLGGAPLDSTIPAEIATLQGLAQPVESKFVTDKNPLPDPLLARIIASSGALTYYPAGARFNLRGRPERVTYSAEWTVRGIEATELSLPELLTGADPVTPLRTLFPLHQTIHLYVFNAISADFPPRGMFWVEEPKKNADHFAAYYGICPPLGEPKIPLHVEAEPIPVKDKDVPEPSETEKEKGLSGTTCPTAQGVLS